MLSIPDMAVLGAAALLFFGPEQLPRVARKAGNVMREIQNTSQSFIRELERAADLQDVKDAKPYEPPPYDPVPYGAVGDGPVVDEGVPPYEPASDPPPFHARAPYEPAAYEPPAPDPERPANGVVAVGAGEKLAEPRPALDREASAPAEAAPETDHPPHL